METKPDPRSFQHASIGATPRLFVEYTGNGDLAVFLHGVGGHRQDWYGQLPAFAERYRALTWDARGYGQSDDYPGPAALNDFCRDLVQVLDYFNADQAHIIGLSMGGFIAQEFYRNFPERVKSLVLAGTSTGFPAIFDAAWIEDFLRTRCEPLRNGVDIADIAPKIATALVSPMASRAARDRAIDSLLKLRKPVYIKTLQAIARHRIRLDYSQVKVPTLILVGAGDQIMPPRASMQLAGAIPGAELVILDGAGHLVNLEKPEQFNSTVLDFLDRHFPSQQRKRQAQ